MIIPIKGRRDLDRPQPRLFGGARDAYPFMSPWSPYNYGISAVTGRSDAGHGHEN